MCLPEKKGNSKNYVFLGVFLPLPMQIKMQTAQVSGMGTLAVFVEDNRFFQEEVALGSARVRYIHLRPRPGICKRFPLRKVRRAAENCFSCQPAYAKQHGLPLLQGNEAQLLHTLAHTLIPKGTQKLAVYPGEGWQAETMLKLAASVRFMELIGDNTEGLATLLSEETGLCVPCYKTEKVEEGKVILRLPGAPKGPGIDLTTSGQGYRLLPPQALKPIFAHIPLSGDMLDALLHFFNLPADKVSVFLSKYTK